MNAREQLFYLVSMLACCMVQSKMERFSIVMDPSEKFNVSWSFDSEENLASTDVTFTITCATSGWVGIGLSPNGGMTGADIIIAWVDDNGQGHLKDMHATQNGLPLMDDSQDVTLNFSSEQNGITMVTFTRKVRTCGKVGDNVLSTSTTRLIYAYGTEDPADNVVSDSDYHGATNRGVRSVYLLDPQSRLEEEPSDVAYFEMLVSNYSVPSTDTTYYCSFYEPPVLDRKHHIISVEPVIQPGNEALVHHILVYACSGVQEKHIRNNNLTEGVCFTAEMPEFFESCRSVVFAWAIGGTKFDFSEVAGYPIRASDNSTPEYFLMEVHYDNPEQRTTWLDSSGLRFAYTPTLRPEDFGIFSVGTVYGIAVPPRSDNFRVVAFCSSNCTEQWIPEDGINVFAFGLHSHLLGVGIQIDWYRNGRLIEVFAKDDSYDFNFQESRLFPSAKKVLPGDTLKITCTYSDSSKDGVTYGGLPSHKEMCLGYLAYYPKAAISDCWSNPNFVLTPNHPLYTGLSLDASVGPYPVNLQVLDTVTEWTEEAVAFLQDAYDINDHTSYCLETGTKIYGVALLTDAAAPVGIVLYSEL